MSTKTILKRVSLVAVAALGIGMLSAVPSNAAPSFADVTVYSAGTQIVGGQATVSITTDTTTTNIAVTGVGSIVSVTGNPTITNGSFVLGSVNTFNIVIASAVAGTTTITATPISSVDGSPMTPVTKTITWIAGAPNTVVNHSTAYINSVNAGADATSDALVVATPIAVSATAGTFGAHLTVKQYASTDSSLPTAAGSTAAVTVSISGAGSVSSVSGGSATGPSVTIGAGTANPLEFYVYGNGVAGVGTITISVGGVTVATKAVTFVGSFAKFSLGTPSKTIIPVGLTGTLVVTAQDANGNTASLPAGFTVTSGTPTVATVATANTSTGSTITITGLAVGTSIITVANAATSPTVTSTFTVTVGKATIKTLTMSTDTTSYVAGGKVTLTVKALGSDGLPVGDGDYAAFSSTGVTSNIGVQGTLPGVAGAVVHFVGGVATYVIYAPVVDATVTLTGTEGADTDSASTAKGTVSVSFDVTTSGGGSSAAVDAANAATDAANYAADAADAATTAAQEATAAAQAAQDSADAATAAVVALGLRVNVLMASVRAQLTSLSNLLVRLIKKLHA